MEVILEVQELFKYFTYGGFLTSKKTTVKAVDGVDLYVRKGETLGLVGESGCGKTTLARSILRLIEATSGKVIFAGQNITSLKKRELLGIRRQMQMVFQDPFSSLDPRMTVEKIVSEPLTTHTSLRGPELRDRIIYLLETVGLQRDQLRRYPHEFSGGQRQRIAIARALSINPEFLVLDEPTSSLDVSVQAQILNLLRELQQAHNLTYLFISHNLNVIHHMSERISVMYLGKIIEEGPVNELFDNPKHPYTQALISVIPTVQPRRADKPTLIAGDTPSPADPPSGCRFRTRCPFAAEICRDKEPALIRIASDRLVACHFVKE
jgi:oligopeptide/dipeptide ABC transporter ATP-binding protein